MTVKTGKRTISRSDYDAAQARIAELEALVASKNTPKALTLKVTEKGGVSVYGLGRFPTTLYASQWSRLLEKSKDITEFIEAHKDVLSFK